MMVRESLDRRLEKARDSAAYRGYLEARERVLDMIGEAGALSSRPSKYWEEETSGFEYMLDASPLVIERLREHCYHLTGLRSYDYRAHHSAGRGSFSGKLQALRNLDGDGLFVPESPSLGGFGHPIDGGLVNMDTLKFYECLIALSKAGLLAGLRGDGGAGKAVLEIGAGWGGFAYQLKTLCPRVTYVIIDLPQSLLFSMTYIKAMFSSARMFVYGDRPLSSLAEELRSYDFVFLPHYSIEAVELPSLDLTVNIASFQEMTTDQVEQYARRTRDLGCKNIYGLNRDRSRYNDELSAVSAVLGKYYEISAISVLPVQYTELEVPPPKPSIARGVLAGVSSPSQGVRGLKRWAVRSLVGRRSGDATHVYRHLAGPRRGRDLTPIPSPPGGEGERADPLPPVTRSGGSPGWHR
jgi:hypothetical protein